MEVNTKTIILKLKKYFVLISIIVFSIGVGSIVFFASLNENMQIQNSVYAVENEQEVKQGYEITLEEIVNKNKVIKEKIEKQTEEIPFETVTVGSQVRNSLATVLTNGRNGAKVVLYKVRYEDEMAISKVEVESSISRKPTSEVVKYEEQKQVASRSGETVNRTATESTTAPVSGYTKVVDMKFTSYCLCKKCTGKSPGDKGYGVTASGYVITPGQNQKVVAVDPKVIPLGSKVYVQGLNGVPDYGYAIAADTGGSIKGNKIDLYVDEHGSGSWWTVGNVRVYVID